MGRTINATLNTAIEVYSRTIFLRITRRPKPPLTTAHHIRRVSGISITKGVEPRSIIDRWPCSRHRISRGSTEKSLIIIICSKGRNPKFPVKVIPCLCPAHKKNIIICRVSTHGTTGPLIPILIQLVGIGIFIMRRYYLFLVCGRKCFIVKILVQPLAEFTAFPCNVFIRILIRFTIQRIFR